CAAVRGRPCGVMQALRCVRRRMVRGGAERGSASGVDPLPRLGLDRKPDPPGVERLGLARADFSVERLALRDGRVRDAASGGHRKAPLPEAGRGWGVLIASGGLCVAPRAMSARVYV